MYLYINGGYFINDHLWLLPGNKTKLLSITSNFFPLVKLVNDKRGDHNFFFTYRNINQCILKFNLPLLSNNIMIYNKIQAVKIH